MLHLFISVAYDCEKWLHGNVSECDCGNAHEIKLKGWRQAEVKQTVNSFYSHNAFNQIQLNDKLREATSKTSGQSNLTTGHIASAHGPFSGICHVAPVCIPPNTCFLGPARVQIPNSISIGSVILAQLMTQRLYTLQWAAIPPSKLPPSMGIWNLDSHLIHDSLSPSESKTQTASRSVQPCCKAHYCDRQTDRPRYSVCNNRTQLRT